VKYPNEKPIIPRNQRLAASDVVAAVKLTDITDESNQLIAIQTTIVKRSRESNP
jgi:hypothetical protein